MRRILYITIAILLVTTLLAINTQIERNRKSQIIEVVLVERSKDNPNISPILVVKSSAIQGLYIPNSINGTTVKIITLAELGANGVNPVTFFAVRFDEISSDFPWSGHLVLSTDYSTYWYHQWNTRQYWDVWWRFDGWFATYGGGDTLV